MEMICIANNIVICSKTFHLTAILYFGMTDIFAEWMDEPHLTFDYFDMMFILH